MARVTLAEYTIRVTVEQEGNEEVLPHVANTLDGFLVANIITTCQFWLDRFLAARIEPKVSCKKVE